MIIRQKLHLRSPGNWLNDPNGFIYYKGKYHLFFQHNPFAPYWANMHWGHAVSEDLVNWEHLGIALYPSVFEDSGGVFSGSAVEDKGRMHVFYTGIRQMDESHTRIESCQMHIVSEDGREFDNGKGKKVVIPAFPEIPGKAGEGEADPGAGPEKQEVREHHPWNSQVPYLSEMKIGDRSDTRDPKVWKGSDGSWYMLLGTTEDNRGKLLLYRSTDLDNWLYAGSCHAPEGWGWMWECPDLFPSGDGHVLLVSPMGLVNDGQHHPEQSICMPVVYEEEKGSLVLPESYQYFDYGMDLYAPQSTLDAEGRRVVVAWLRMPEAVQASRDPALSEEERDETQGLDWSGMFCLPRVAELKNGHIWFHMHPNVRKSAHLAQCQDLQGASGRRPVRRMLSFDLREGEKADLGGYLIYRKDGRLTADRSRVFAGHAEKGYVFSTPRICHGDRIDAVVDRNCIELYVNDGEYVMTHAVYHLGDDCSFPEGREVEIWEW